MLNPLNDFDLVTHLSHSAGIRVNSRYLLSRNGTRLCIPDSYFLFKYSLILTQGFILSQQLACVGRLRDMDGSVGRADEVCQLCKATH